MTENMIIDRLCKIIRDNGKIVNRAKSAWGADKYEYINNPHIYTTVEDDGYTMGVFWTNRLEVRHTAGYDAVYKKGTQKDLMELYNKLT